VTVPWYVSSFGESYLDLYSHRDDVEAEAQVGSILDLLDPLPEGPLLDLCCGAGRHLAALRRAGVKNLVGIDLSADLLRAAKAKLSDPSAEPVELVRCDMRRLPHAGCFAAVLSLFNSFGYFREDPSNEKFILGVQRALRRGGKFLMDYLNRDHVLENLIASDTVSRGDLTARHSRWITGDGKRVEKRTEVSFPGGESRTFVESVRLFSPEEMEGMFRRAGFRRVRFLGGLEGGPFSPTSGNLVIVAEKP
jgi:SAM-dependent methyltransferase